MDKVKKVLYGHFMVILWSFKVIISNKKGENAHITHSLLNDGR